MSDTLILKKMINDSAKIQLENHYDKRKAVLIEHGTTGSRLEIFNIPSDAIIIDVDSNFENQKIFSGASDECKRSDYIIISESERVVLFIEMKKGSSSTSEIVKQLKGSLCIFNYCQAIAREFFDRDDFLSTYKKRFIAFKNVNLDKKKTRIDKRKNSHSSPDTLMKVSQTNNIQFKKIAA